MKNRFYQTLHYGLWFITLAIGGPWYAWSRRKG